MLWLPDSYTISVIKTVFLVVNWAQYTILVLSKPKKGSLFSQIVLSIVAAAAGA
jgi:hypothetical protein